MFAALCGGKGSLPRDQVENLVEKRRLCLGSLKKISEEYRSKSDDMRIVLEHSEKEYTYEGKKLRWSGHWIIERFIMWGLFNLSIYKNDLVNIKSEI